MPTQPTSESVPWPEPTCQAVTSIVDPWSWPSTGGPVKHFKTSCPSGHHLTVLAESLLTDPALAATRGLRVSELCLGTMSVGGAWAWGFGADERGDPGQLPRPGRDRRVVATRYTLAPCAPGDPNKVSTEENKQRPGLREEVNEHYQQLLAGFPDLQVTIETT